VCLLILISKIDAFAESKQTLYNSPYITWSPDGSACTTNYLEYLTDWYEEDTTVYTGIPLKVDYSTLTPPVGMHIYQYNKESTELPLYKWHVDYGTHICIHSGSASTTGYCGLSYVKNGWNYDNKFTYTINCHANRLPSGWVATCADCGTEFRLYVYATKEAIETIDYLDTTKGYFYICPWDGALEQASGFNHKCKELSYNMYEVVYSQNAPAGVAGYMPESRHMYNNVNVYNGQPITPQTSLSPCGYSRIGYKFTGWNTKPDGSGQSFADGAEILNLCTGDINLWQEDSSITLYAQWADCSSTLEIDPNKGSYKGSSSIYDITKKYLETYQVNSSDLTPPEGVNVAFETNGGTVIPSIKTTMHFDHWETKAPMYGKFVSNLYTFGSTDSIKDRITAHYDYDSFVLPPCSKPGYQFSGWFYDPNFTKPAGPVGAIITPTTDMTIYACWASLTLYSTDNYSVYNGTGGVDLRWEMEHATNSNTYKLYRSSNDGITWEVINNVSDIQNGVTVNKSFTPAGTQTYTVPYTGLYTLTASGAQGSDYSGNTWDGIHKDFIGGKGGTVTGNFWLQAGEKITYSVGNRNGSSDDAKIYAGGSALNVGTAAAPSYVGSAGGGATYVSSDKQGILLIAGGGGGASLGGNGEPGGSDTVTTTTSAGASGGAGGGGGYLGGDKGTYEVHTHVASCYTDSSVDCLTKYGSKFYKSYGFEEIEDSDTDRYWVDIYGGTPSNLIPVDGNTKLEVNVTSHATSDSHPGIGSGYLAIYDQNGNELYKEKDGPQHGRYGVNEYDDVDDDDSITISFGRYGSNYKKHYTYSDTSYSDIQWECNDACKATHEYFLWGYDEYNMEQFAFANHETMFHTAGTRYYFATQTYYSVVLDLPSTVTGIYIRGMTGSQYHYWGDWGHYHDGSSGSFSKVYLSGGKRLICGMEQGQIISATPSYGGSNYVNTTAAYSHTSTGGDHSGNGSFTIQSKALGFVTANNLDGVLARDWAKPNAIDSNTAKFTNLDGSHVQVTWQEPKDNGTEYKFRAEAYLIADDIASQTPVESNWVSNTLTSGVDKYYIIVDTNPLTIVTDINKQATVNQSHSVGYHTSWHKESNDTASYTVPIIAQVQYLHIAAVDKADNIASTVHIKIDLLETSIAWNVYTRQIEIQDKDPSGSNLDNIYKKSDEAKTYYVRADGITPFTLDHKSYLDGYARLNYMINQVRFNVRPESSTDTVLHNYLVPIADNLSGTAYYNKSLITLQVTKESWLKDYALTNAYRTNVMKDLELDQAFTIASAYSGLRLKLIPSAGADQKDADTKWSEYDLDKNNDIILIPDAEAPEISITTPSGVTIEDINGEHVLIDRSDLDEFILNITADDHDLSGVRSLVVEIENHDNHCTDTLLPDATGKINVNILKQRYEDDEYLFSGDFTIKIIATDNVGNISEKELNYYEFALKTSLVKIPYYDSADVIDGVTYFRCGESGMLIVTTYGYADEAWIEYPADLLEQNPHLANMSHFYYSDGSDLSNYAEYRKVEKPTFMIPLHIVDGTQYEIIVHAYKKDKELTDTQRFAVISGTVLDDLQTKIE